MNLFLRPRYKTFYAVRGGEHLGKFILFIKKEGLIYHALAMGAGREPFKEDNVKAIQISVKDVRDGLKYNIIEAIPEKIDKAMLELCQKEWLFQTTKKDS